MRVPNLLRFRTAQKINQICYAHSLIGSRNCAQSFLRDDRAVECFKCRVAVVAVAAVFGKFFVEIIEKKFAAADFDLAVFAHQLAFEHYVGLRFVIFDFGESLLI